MFLHGNPTSSYLWRKVLPHLESSGRCVALDLIGMATFSDKPDIDYTFADHASYLADFLRELAADDLVLVGHDWGAVLALDVLARSVVPVSAVVLCEGHLRPIESWADTDPGFAELFGRLRTPGVGERLVMEENVFVEQVLPAGMSHVLSAEEREAYAAPYPTPASRRPVWQWIQQIPIEGSPADVAMRWSRANGAALAATTVPVLLLHGEPGSVVSARHRRLGACHRSPGHRAVGGTRDALPPGGPAGGHRGGDRRVAADAHRVKATSMRVSVGWTVMSGSWVVAGPLVVPEAVTLWVPVWSTR